ncbi:MAG: tetratricopeptide repeat protein [Candidatus Latescibacterota bacterium]|nr:MAG: tetratricopeptide repeat protein [Candidatus Latescibacterota bacterium]
MFWLRKKDKDSSSQQSYITALKRMIDDNQESAFLALQDAVKSGGAPTDAYIRLGSLLRERGDAGKAVQIHQSLTVKTNLSKNEKIELFLNLAEDYAHLGNSERSARTLETAVKTLNIKDPAVFIKIGKQYHVLGQTEKAYEALKDAKRYGGIGDRELALYLGSSAEQLIEREDTKEAKKVLQRALKHDADSAPILLMLGDVAELQGDIDEAIVKWRQAAVLSPQLADTALHKLERVLYDKGRFGEIEKIYEDIRTARGGDETASLATAALYKKQGRTEDAIQLLEEYITVYPGSARGRLLLISLYAKYRDPDALERFLDDSIKQSWERKPFVCQSCQFQSESMRWHCPRCNAFDTFSTDYEI